LTTNPTFNLEQTERNTISLALQNSGYNKSKAATLLEIIGYDIALLGVRWLSKTPAELALCARRIPEKPGQAVLVALFFGSFFWAS